MRKLFIITAAVLLSLTVSSVAQQAATSARIVSAAEAFIASLDDTQRKSVLYDFNDNGQRARWSNFPTGVVPRGGELIIPKEQRDLAAKRPNPVKTSDASIAIGRERFTTYCVPCHGPEAKGGTTGPVAAKFIPTPDLTNTELQRQRTDGYWYSYIVVGGAVMPAYGEALSSQEAWHIVNFLRSIAQK